MALFNGARLCYRDALVSQGSGDHIRSTAAQAFEPDCINNPKRFDCWEKFETTVRRLDFLSQRIESFLDIEWLQAGETDSLSLRLQQNRSFLSIKMKLLMARVLPYESNLGPLMLHNKTSTPLVASVSKKAADNDAVIRSKDFALHELEHVSSKIVLKMITAISREIPFYIEEVEAISHHLNSRFNALNPKISIAKSTQGFNPSR